MDLLLSDILGLDLPDRHYSTGTPVSKIISHLKLGLDLPYRHYSTGTPVSKIISQLKQSPSWLEESKQLLRGKRHFVSIDSSYRLNKLFVGKKIPVSFLDQFTFCVVGGDIKVIYGDYEDDELFSLSSTKDQILINEQYLPKFRTGIVGKCHFGSSGRMLLDKALSASFNSKKEWLSLYFLLINSLQLQIVADDGKTYVQFVKEAVVDVCSDEIKHHIANQTIDDLTCKCLVSFLRNFTSPVFSGGLQQGYLSRLDGGFFTRYSDIFSGDSYISLVDANVEAGANPLGRTINARAGGAYYGTDEEDDDEFSSIRKRFITRIQKTVYSYYVFVNVENAEDGDIQVSWELARDYLGGVELVSDRQRWEAVLCPGGKQKLKIPLQSRRLLLKSELQHLLILTGKRYGTDEGVLLNGGTSMELDAVTEEEAKAEAEVKIREEAGAGRRRFRYQNVSVTAHVYEYNFKVHVRNSCQYDINFLWEFEKQEEYQISISNINNDVDEVSEIKERHKVIKDSESTINIRLTSKHQVPKDLIARHLFIRGHTVYGIVPVYLNRCETISLDEWGETRVSVSLPVFYHSAHVRIVNTVPCVIRILATVKTILRSDFYTLELNSRIVNASQTKLVSIQLESHMQTLEDYASVSLTVRRDDGSMYPALFFDYDLNKFELPLVSAVTDVPREDVCEVKVTESVGRVLAAHEIKLNSLDRLKNKCDALEKELEEARTSYRNNKLQLRSFEKLHVSKLKTVRKASKTSKE